MAQRINIDWNGLLSNFGQRLRPINQKVRRLIKKQIDNETNIQRIIDSDRALLGTKNNILKRLAELIGRQEGKTQQGIAEIEVLVRGLDQLTARQIVLFRVDIRLTRRDYSYGKDITHILAGQLLHQKDVVAREAEIHDAVMRKIKEVTVTSPTPFDANLIGLFQRHYTDEIQTKKMSQAESDRANEAFAEEKVVQRAVDELVHILDNQRGIISGDHKNGRFELDKFNVLFQDEQKRYAILMNYNKYARGINYDLKKGMVDLHGRSRLLESMGMAGKVAQAGITAVTVIAMGLVWANREGTPANRDAIFDWLTSSNTAAAPVVVEPEPTTLWGRAWRRALRGWQNPETREFDRAVGRLAAEATSASMEGMINAFESAIDQGLLPDNNITRNMVRALRAIQWMINNYVLTIAVLAYVGLRMIPIVNIIPRWHARQFWKGIGVWISSPYLFVKWYRENYPAIARGAANKKISQRSIVKLLEDAFRRAGIALKRRPKKRK